MKIAIMGTGTMACLFAGRMVQKGHEVFMISRWKEQVEKISKDGLILSSTNCDDSILRPTTTLNAEDASRNGFPELVMISCKGYMTEHTVKNALPVIGPETRVLTLQNGMGNAEVIASYVDPARVWFGAASLASDAQGLGHVKDNTNLNRSPLISIVPFTRKNDEWCDIFSDLFNDLGYDTVAGASAEYFVWKKLCLNSCGNALAGISQLANNVYSNDLDGFILLSQLCSECTAVARAAGVMINNDEMRAFIQKTFYNQAHYISMCQDMHHARPTEIETINGFIVRRGRELGIPTPVNETMYHLVKLISGHYSDRWV